MLNSFLVFISMFFIMGFTVGERGRESYPFPLYFYIITGYSLYFYDAIKETSEMWRIHRSFAFIMTFRFCLDPMKLQWVRCSWETICWKLERWEKKNQISQLYHYSMLFTFFSLPRLSSCKTVQFMEGNQGIELTLPWYILSF